MPRRRRPARPGALNDLAPRRILTQIVLLQLIYYAVAGLLIVFTTLVAGKKVSPDLVFSWRAVRADVTTGWTLALCWMLDSFVCVIFILLLIARSKLVPDFALTIHFLHLVVVSVYTKTLPTQLFWWGLQLASVALMTALGMWACQWRELKPINFGGNRSGSVAGVITTERVGHSSGEGAALLTAVAGGGAAGRDDVYEMIGMKAKDDNV